MNIYDFTNAHDSFALQYWGNIIDLLIWLVSAGITIFILMSFASNPDKFIENLKKKHKPNKDKNHDLC